jgi:hypothetical protein
MRLRHVAAMGLEEDPKAQGRRLVQARERAGYETGTDGAKALKVVKDTYLQHENGTRSLKRAARLYAEKYEVPAEWLIWGSNPPEWADEEVRPELAQRRVRVVGYVGAGAVATLFATAQGPFDEVEPPIGATDDTVAVEVRGVSLGPAFDNALVFYDDVRKPVTEDQHGRLCVVGLTDGRVLVKIVRAATEGRFHLLSNTAEEPLWDQEVEWAARVTDIRPR